MVMTVDELKSAYGFRFTEGNRDMVQNALASAEEICIRYMGFDEGLKMAVEEYFDGGSGIICLGYAPVVGNVRVSIDAERVFSSVLDSRDYRVDMKTGTVMVYSAIPTGRDVVKVSYEAGYEEAPVQVKLAIAMTCQKILADMQQSLVGIQTRNIDGGTETYDQSLPTLAVRQALDSFRVKRAR